MVWINLLSKKYFSKDKGDSFLRRELSLKNEKTVFSKVIILPLDISI
jgi:hypothetical protein